MSRSFKNVMWFLVGFFAIQWAVFSWFNGGKTRDVSPLLRKLGDPTSPTATKIPIMRLVDPVERISCSGYVVDGSHLLTCAHCLNKTGHLPTYDLLAYEAGSNKDPIKVSAVAYDTGTDIGIIQGNFADFKAVKMDLDESFLEKKQYYTCGFSYGRKDLFCSVFIPETNSYADIHGVGRVYPGVSGGLVLDPSTASAVGLVSAFGEGVTVVVPLVGLLGIFPGLDPS